MTISKLSFFKRIWQRWLDFGVWLGNIMSYVWIPLFYFVAMAPFALLMKCFTDPLRLRGGLRSSYWTPKQLPRQDLHWAQSLGTPSSSETTERKSKSYRFGPSV